MKSPEFLIQSAIPVIKKAGAFIAEQRRNFDSSVVEHKGFNDLVSYVDKQAEKMLVDGLESQFPEAGFITEEQTKTLHGREVEWIIDPLDGTTNFVHGVPVYCVSVGLRTDGVLSGGIVYEVNLDECFYGWKGGGVFLNGKPIKTSPANKMSNALVVTGFPYTNFSRLDAYMQIFDYCMRNTHGIRRPGSAAVDLAYVASGRFEVFYEYGLNPWDVAGGSFLVQEAGGIVTDFSGGDNFLFGKEIVAAAAGVHAEFMQEIKKRFS
jgi:myo-inositol-1(or 4)-monophosphatase